MKGLVLEGGGAKGAFQIGAYKALKELGIKIDGVAGTSIGALNGALIAQGDEEKAHEVWTNISTSSLFQLTEEQFEKFVKLDISSADIPLFLGKLKNLFKNKGLDVSQIKNLLQELIDEEKLRASSMDFGLVTYSLTTLKPFELFIDDIPDGEIINYLMASASLPVFKLEKLDGNLFIDGGVFDNMPINLLIKKGYKDIIVIRTFGIGMYKKIIDSSVKVTYINPSEDLGGILDFNNKLANKNLSLGYYDTMKYFQHWKGSRFYIRPEPTDEKAFSLLLNFSDQVITDIGQIFGYENIPAKRMLFEFIIPRIVDLLCLPKDSSYQDILIGICEEIAEDINIERFQLYSVDEFIKTITDNYQPVKGKRKTKMKANLQGFLQKNELFSKFVKDKIFKEIASKIIQ